MQRRPVLHLVATLQLILLAGNTVILERTVCLMWHMNVPKIKSCIDVTPASCAGDDGDGVHARWRLWGLPWLGTPSSPRRLGWYNRGRHIALGIARGLMYLHAQKVAASVPWLHISDLRDCFSENYQALLSLHC